MNHSLRFIDGALLLARDASGAPRLPIPAETEALPVAGERFTLADGRADAAAVVPGTPLPPALEAVGLRPACNMLPATQYAWAVKAAELLNWDAASTHCGFCGAPMMRATQISKRCSGCGRELFPHISPCVIVLVTRGPKALLVHSSNFSRPYYGLVAGFVETGETLEECVHRELWEETRLRVKNLRYFGSQPWPYPGQLMIGFTAEYADGTLTFADGELTDGGFFPPESLPPIPSPPSLARVMIDKWRTTCAKL